MIRNYSLDKYILKHNRADGPDFLVNIKETGICHLQVECKGSNDDVDRAIGQTLGYIITYNAPIFLAIPENYRYFRYLEKVIESFNLPLGILIVSDQEITKKRDLKGVEG